MRLRHASCTLTLLVVVMCLPVACTPTDDDDDTSSSSSGGNQTFGECHPEPTFQENVSTCQPLSTDYQPRVNQSASDSWPACISDDNTYHPIETSISTVARVQAFEQIREKLWKEPRVPTVQDFTDARVIYTQEQGLDSRVQRREDVHYPADSQGRKCSEAGVPDANPDRCVGPAKLLPILNDAFQKGMQGQDGAVQAARIEAALVWFLYVSPLSEVTSCTTTPKDCDSAWAYYTGGTPRDQPMGLAGYVDALGPETHDRAYDAALGVRCWRNLDNETTTATNLTLRDQVRTQLDVATVRGVALVLRQRIKRLECATGDARNAALAFISTLGPFLDRAGRERNVQAADSLKAQVQAAQNNQVDVTAAVSALDALFPCP